MGISYAAAKGQPHLVPSGSAPTFAADVGEIVDWLQAGRTARRLTTYAGLLTATGMADNDLAVCDNVDGAYFKYDDSVAKWIMCGTAIFASSGARASAIAAPVQGMRTKLMTTGAIEEYFELYNASTNPAGTIAAGWYPVGGIMPALEVTDTANQTVSALAVITAWATEEYRRVLPSLVAGVFTVPAGLGGRYSLAGYLKTVAGSGIGSYLELRKGATTIVAASDGSSSSNGAFLSVHAEIVLAVTDTISMAAFRTSSGVVTSRRMSIRYLGPA
jgi:hypothetical protein